MSWIQSDFQYTEKYTPPSWSTGTDEEIVTALEKYYNDEIDLSEYWSVGDERTVSLSAIEQWWTGWMYYSAHAAQDITLVLLHSGGYDLVTPINGHTKCAFIVGQKTALSDGNNDYMMGNSSVYSALWGTQSSNTDTVRRRIWCNEVYKNAFPSSIRSIFKEHITPGVYQCHDYFAIPSEYELFGANNTYYSTSESENLQFDYYKTSENRISSENDSLITRTKGKSDYQNSFRKINSYTNSVNSTSYHLAGSIRPIGCI